MKGPLTYDMRPGFWLTMVIFFDTLNKIERKLNEME